MATVTLPYYSPRAGYAVTDPWAWEHNQVKLTLPVDRIHPQNHRRGLVLGYPTLNQIQVPPGYVIRDDELVQAVNNDAKIGSEHPTSISGHTRYWGNMIVHFKEGEDDPVVMGTELRSPPGVTVRCETREGHVFELPSYYDLPCAVGDRIFALLDRVQAERYSVFLTRGDAGTILPAKSRSAFCTRLRLMTPEEAQAANVAALPKGRDLLPVARSFPMPREIMTWSGMGTLGLRNDLSGFRLADRDPMGAVIDNRTHRVYIHRDDWGWRFFFLLAGRTMSGGTYEVSFTRLDVNHGFAVTVPHKDTDGSRFTFRGLPLEVQKSIWSVPGMSSALTLALNTLRGRVKALPLPLHRWQGPPVTRLGHCLFLPDADWVNYYLTGRGRRGFDISDRSTIGMLNTMISCLPVNHLKHRRDVGAPVAPAVEKKSKRLIDL